MLSGISEHTLQQHTLLIPKSPSLMRPWLVMKTLLALMSRCMMPTCSRQHQPKSDNTVVMYMALNIFCQYSADITQSSVSYCSFQDTFVEQHTETPPPKHHLTACTCDSAEMSCTK